MTKSEGHPKGLYLLFTVEMWERFSYYGMRALLVLYMTKFLMFNTESASKIYGYYTGLVYMTPMIGGYLADRYLGHRTCVLIGGLIMAIGHLVMAFPALPYFYTALGLLIIGNGLFKPNISTMVGALYGENDPRRDGGFTIFYMGINLGALFSPLVCGTLGEKVGWHYGFGAAGVGMLAGLAVYMWGAKKYLGDIGLKPVITKEEIANQKPLTKTEWQRIGVIFVLAFFVIFFWAAFEQAGSSMTLFADRETDRMIFGWEFPTSWFQSVNPLLIFICAPAFSSLWLKLAKMKKNPSTPMKFVIGLLLLTFGFVLMIGAASLYKQSGPVSMFWLLGAYMFHTLGELCLSPVGLSMVTKLAPAKFVSLLMGTWFLSNAASNLVGGLFAGNYDKMDHATFYLIPTVTAGGSAILLLLLVPMLKKWMNGID
jgi:POT family proton-dependent oligopeptide transporter